MPFIITRPPSQPPIAMATKLEAQSFMEEPEDPDCFDDDGRVQRTGTLLTASAHIITAVIGSGVLTLPWAMAQLGWIAGIATLFFFCLVTWFCTALQADCYRSPDPITGKRNYTYKHAVRAHLGGLNVKMCGLVQNVKFVGVAIGYVITASTSMAAVKKSNCFHKNGHEAACSEPVSAYMMIFAATEIVLSQLPNFHKIWWLSFIAAATSIVYASIGVGLSIAKIAEDGVAWTTITGVEIGVDVSGSEKVWRTFQALGNVAVAFSFALVLIEIQDTLKSSPPENEVMKKASFIGLTTTTVFYMLCGICGYAAFGNSAPGNFLTGFAVYEPFWLINIANICIVIHLVGAYQVFNQPLFQLVENWSRKHWPDHVFLTAEHTITIPLCGNFSINFFRVIWRTLYVLLTTMVAILLPFFNSFLALLGALGFWPLTVYFPIEMYISHAEIKRFSAVWIMLRLLSLVCLGVSLAAACGAIQGIASQLISHSSIKFSGKTNLQPIWLVYL